MNEWFIYSLILIFSVSMWNLSYSYSKVSRVFYGYGKSIPESSVYGVAYTPPDASSKPYFDMALVEEKTERYFASYLKEGEYSYELIFPEEKKISFFTLSFKGNVHSFFVFSKNATFYIKEGFKNAS